MTAHALFDRNYNPNWPLAGDELAARRTDPVSSHEAAKNHFGAKGLDKDILAVFARPEYRDRWLTCDDLIRAIFGDGPYDLKTAKRLNKVQTIALKLYRRGLLRRLEPAPGSGDVLRYKLREDI
jgi:hypothetical protein